MPTLKKSKTKSAAPKAAFNHAMIYSTDVERSLAFYQGALGFRLIETFKGGPRVVYARLQAPAGKTTIALHQAGPGESIASPGIRLYFEVKQLDSVCEKTSEKKPFPQQPTPLVALLNFRVRDTASLPVKSAHDLREPRDETQR